MNQPQATDPCSSIRDAIEETQERIRSDQFDLQHPEDLTNEQEVAIGKDLEAARRKLQHLKVDLRRCQEQNPHTDIAATIPAEAGWDG